MGEPACVLHCGRAGGRVVQLGLMQLGGQNREMVQSGGRGQVNPSSSRRRRRSSSLPPAAVRADLQVLLIQNLFLSGESILRERLQTLCFLF